MSVLAPAGILGTVFKFAFGGPVKDVAGAALSVVNGWVVTGAEAMLREVISVISLVTTPSLSNSWFSVHYWQVAALSMLLTVPFLFAAAVQAILRSDLTLLARAAFFDLPIAAIAVYAAAPLITLILSATDEMCSLVSGGGPVGGSFLSGLPLDLSQAGSGFLVVVIAIVILIAGMVLLVELIVRAAAIYVVVLFLPLGFAAMVWPARRIWIKRMLETLIALILSKFAMVAILTLAVTALASLSQHPTALTTALTAMALIVLSTLSPWALLRLLPFTEMAAEAALLLHRDAKESPLNNQTTRQAAADIGTGAIVDPLAGGAAALRRYAGQAFSGSEDGRGFRRAAMSVVGGDGAAGAGGGDGSGAAGAGGGDGSGAAGPSRDGSPGSPDGSGPSWVSGPAGPRPTGPGPDGPTGADGSVAPRPAAATPASASEDLRAPGPAAQAPTPVAGARTRWEPPFTADQEVNLSRGRPSFVTPRDRHPDGEEQG